MVQWLVEFLGLKRNFSRDEIIRLRYQTGGKLADIARSLGLSPQQVYQIVKLEKRSSMSTVCPTERSRQMK
jgi:transposase-like protein